MGARPGSIKFSILNQSLDNETKSVREGETLRHLETSFNLCREFGTIDENSGRSAKEVGTNSIVNKSARVEVGPHKHLRRGVNLEHFNYITREESGWKSWNQRFPPLDNPKVEEKQFETLNKETATHIGIQKPEDWFRPIDLAKECEVYISSKTDHSLSVPSFLYVSDSPLVSMKKEKRKTYRYVQRTVRLADCGSQSQAVFARRRS
ncbi:hypothetical protein TNCV_4506931 [Trichonephila clavipes]|nr:hypothetical protein TNCV_4506931 [Trichonephila clavipes]